jgi:acetyl esterase/lipase
MVINWFGIYDVPDVIDGPHKADAAVRWFGSLPNRMEIARRVSPLTYVRAGLPPIITIHGDADTTVPYDQAVRLHAALAKVNVPNQLVTIPGGRHGNFTPDQRDKIYLTIRDSLENGSPAPTATPAGRTDAYISRAATGFFFRLGNPSPPSHRCL